MSFFSVEYARSSVAAAHFCGAEGDRTIADALFCGAEAIRNAAEGVWTIADALFCGAEGVWTIADALFCGAEGVWTIAEGVQIVVPKIGFALAGFLELYDQKAVLWVNHQIFISKIKTLCRQKHISRVKIVTRF